MTVWVVYRDYGIEGCSEPLGVFTSYEKAIRFTQSEKNNWSQSWEIRPLVVDAE